MPCHACIKGPGARISSDVWHLVCREDFIVATKVAGPGGMDWLRGGPLAMDAANITAAIDGSLARLRTDYIDLIQLHWPDR